MAMYTVKDLAALFAITSRAARYCQKIGLLEPTSFGENGYRYYGEEALSRLQQILFYRELGMPLADIRSILSGRDFDSLQALQRHGSALTPQLKRIRRLIRTIDNTMRGLEGGLKLQPKHLFEGFTDEERQALSREAERRWNSRTVRQSNRRWQSYSPEKRQTILEEGKALYADLAAAMPQGAKSPEVQKIVARWRLHLKHFWSPSDQQLLGLANLYNQDPRFRQNYEKTAPGLAAFLLEAVHVFVESRSG